MGVFLPVFLVIVLSQFCSAQDFMIVEGIPGYIRDLIKDFNRKDSNVHDVAIINLENEENSDYINEIIMELPEENAVIISRIDTILDDPRIGKASFIIITADTIDAVNFNYISHVFN